MNKKILLESLFIISILIFYACNHKNEAPLSEISVVPIDSVLHYKLGKTNNFNIHLLISKGASIDDIQPYMIFYELYGDSSNSKTLASIPVDGANTYTDMDLILKINYDDLTKDFYIDYPLSPGDGWLIRYNAFMTDLNRTSIKKGTMISIDNYFSGKYKSDIKYFEPETGDYPNNYKIYENDDKELIAQNIFVSRTNFGIWNSEIATMDIRPWSNDSISFNVNNWDYNVVPGDPYDSSKICYIDSVSGVIYLYYYFLDKKGQNIFWEVLIPS